MFRGRTGAGARTEARQRPWSIEAFRARRGFDSPGREVPIVARPGARAQPASRHQRHSTIAAAELDGTRHTDRTPPTRCSRGAEHGLGSKGRPSRPRARPEPTPEEAQRWSTSAGRVRTLSRALRDPLRRCVSTCSMTARGKGNAGLLQLPSFSAKASVSQRAMPRLCTTMTSRANGPRGFSQTRDASAAASFSVRLLRMSSMRSARRKLSLQVLHTSSERDLEQLLARPGLDRIACQAPVREPAEYGASVRMRLESHHT